MSKFQKSKSENLRKIPKVFFYPYFFYLRSFTSFNISFFITLITNQVQVKIDMV